MWCLCQRPCTLDLSHSATSRVQGQSNMCVACSICPKPALYTGLGTASACSAWAWSQCIYCRQHISLIQGACCMYTGLALHIGIQPSLQTSPAPLIQPVGPDKFHTSVLAVTDTSSPCFRDSTSLPLYLKQAWEVILNGVGRRMGERQG